MKITKISTMVVNARMRNWVFVKVETDQPGLYGWGESTLEWKTKGVVGAIEDLSVLLIGQNPLRVEHLWQVMHRQYFWRGGITNFSAISGIDQALWDIKGKECGKPVCELLGGPVRDTLRFYDHLGGGTLEGMYKTVEPEEFGARIQDSLSRGFTAVKAMPIPVSEYIESASTLKRAAKCVEAMRLSAGDDIDIMLDLHARTTPAAAIQFGRMLVDYNLYWYEEPCWPEHTEALVEVARALPYPIATGERLVGRWEFRELFEKRACSIIQPDVSHCGGISEARRIAAMAETYQMSVACHNPQGPVSTAASTHVGFATPNYLIQEMVRADVPWRNDVVSEFIPLEAGICTAPTRPGLGIDINETEAAKYPFQPEVLMAYNHRDGSVADW
ncbi:galactonate dehydratase [Paludibaculum fermentans]|uniref:Galactonate dehydratase n=1 Tax=Paludibaculum fermentans TaxID=1473598 RepID=A0A7S7NRF3_PALFE|nr:galactonate dehydratase [Paludibaculum fermentans]QOY88407.1 galactonate dehydratase [Paludibaculum fermentans]